MDKRLLALFVFALLLRLVLIPSNPYPLSDSFWHYQHAKDMFEYGYVDRVLNNLWHGTDLPQPTDYRPPIYNLLVAFFLMIYASLQSAQVASALFGALLIIPAYLLAKHFFGRTAATWVAFFVALNPYLLQMSIEVQPRMLASTLVLSMIYLVLKEKPGLAGLAAGLAYLTHYSTVFFILPTLAYAAYKRQNVLIIFIIFLLVCSPWFVRNIVFFGDPLYTSSRYLSIMSHIEEYHAFSPPTLSGYLQKVGLVGAVSARLINLVTSYVPPPQKVLEYGVTWTLSYPLIGIITPAVFIAGLMAALKRPKNPIVLIVLAASLLAPITMGFPRANGVSIDNLTHVVPLAGILAFGWLYQTGRRGWMLTLMMLLLLQGVFLFNQYPHELNTVAIDEARSLPDGSKVMSRDAYMFAFYLPEKNITWVTTPYCTEEELQQFIIDQKIDYYLKTDADINRSPY